MRFFTAAGEKSVSSSSYLCTPIVGRVLGRVGELLVPVAIGERGERDVSAARTAGVDRASAQRSDEPQRADVTHGTS